MLTRCLLHDRSVHPDRRRVDRPLTVKPPASKHEQPFVQRSSRLGMENPFGAAANRLRLGRSVAYCGETDPAVFGEAADHVENHPHLPRLVEVKIVRGDDVEQVLDAEATQERGFQVIGRNQVLLAAAGSEEQPGHRVIPTVGQELQRQEGVGRATLAEIDFDGVGRPIPASFWTTTKSSANRPNTPSRASRAPIFAARAVIAGA